METTEVKLEKGVNFIKSEVIIEGSKEKVWDVLKYPGRIQEFHPLIKKSYVIGEKVNGVGSKRCCELLPMGQMIERIVEWQEGESYTTEVIGGKILPPYKFMKGVVNLIQKDNATIVSFCFSYQLKSEILDRLFVRRNFKNAPKKYVNGLKAYVESN